MSNTCEYVASIKELSWKARIRASDGRTAFKKAVELAGREVGHLHKKHGKLVPVRNLMCIRFG